MKYRFEISYVLFTHLEDPPPDLTSSSLHMIIERTAHESVSLDIVRQQVAFELEEQGYRIISIEGETIE